MYFVFNLVFHHQLDSKIQRFNSASRICVIVDRFDNEKLHFKHIGFV